MKFCPSCRSGWPAARPVCPDCLTPLVDDLAATLRCRHCGKDWPATMSTCPSCLAVLQVDPDEAVEALQGILATGARVLRPVHLPVFRDGPSCTLMRLSARGGLVFAGLDDFLEAEVDGPSDRAIPPLTCRDVDGSLLFLLHHYEPVAGALVAYGAGGAPLGTYLRDGRGIEVRDETSAPVAALRPVRGGYDLAETGGGAVARCEPTDVELDGWIDDRWSLQAGPRPLPLKTVAAVALVLAAKVMFGRPRPDKGWEQEDPDQGQWTPQ